MREAAADGANLIGLTESELQNLLGAPSSRRDIGTDVWLVFATSDFTLRARCSESGDANRCVSWTAVFPDGLRLLSEAAGLVGLWPLVQPDENADEVEAPLIRRRLSMPGRAMVHSFTAAIRNGRIVSVSAFDEAPDWT